MKQKTVRLLWQFRRSTGNYLPTLHFNWTSPRRTPVEEIFYFQVIRIYSNRRFSALLILCKISTDRDLKAQKEIRHNIQGQDQENSVSEALLNRMVSTHPSSQLKHQIRMGASFVCFLIETQKNNSLWVPVISHSLENSLPHPREQRLLNELARSLDRE